MSRAFRLGAIAVIAAVGHNGRVIVELIARMEALLEPLGAQQAWGQPERAAGVARSAG
jgi:hypothetical protein